MVHFWILCCLRCFGGMLGVRPLGSVPVFVLFECGLVVFRCVHRLIAVGHNAGDREDHVDARWCLCHRAVFNG